MPAEQFANGELLQEYRRASSSTAHASAGRERQLDIVEKAIWAATHSAAPALDGIKIDSRDRLWSSESPHSSKAIRGGYLIGAMVLTFGLAWAGGWKLNQMIERNSVATTASIIPEQAASPSIRSADPNKGDRLQSGDVRAVHEAARIETQVIKNPKSSATSEMGRNSKHPPVHGTVQPAAISTSNTISTNKTPQAARPPSAPIVSAAIAVEPREKLKPIPETKPTTIDGWTVREVIDGIAVLEGPDGIVRAARGDNVPGAGKVFTIVRWGNRWIVATSKGLITTQ